MSTFFGGMTRLAHTQHKPNTHNGTFISQSIDYWLDCETGKGEGEKACEKGTPKIKYCEKLSNPREIIARKLHNK